MPNDPKMKDSELSLDERISRAIKRITQGDAAMRIPVEATDPDIVLADCQAELRRIAGERVELGHFKAPLILHEKREQMHCGETLWSFCLRDSSGIVVFVDSENDEPVAADLRALFAAMVRVVGGGR